jgi:hypothetical protein
MKHSTRTLRININDRLIKHFQESGRRKICRLLASRLSIHRTVWFSSRNHKKCTIAKISNEDYSTEFVSGILQTI